MGPHGLRQAVENGGPRAGIVDRRYAVPQYPVGLGPSGNALLTRHAGLQMLGERHLVLRGKGALGIGKPRPPIEIGVCYGPIALMRLELIIRSARDPAE